MARLSGIEKMNHAELVAFRAEIDRVILDKQAAERAALKLRLAEMAKAQGFSLDEVLGRGGKRGSVPIKYRDPKNPSNTWTGRGRMPRWMVAATKGTKVKADDFLV